MNLSDQERALAAENFQTEIGVNRRQFLAASLAAAGTTGVGLGAFYFGYEKVKDPVRFGVIGTGDEGSVLMGAHNPEYAQIVAISDIRPYNVHRAFHGDEASPNAKRERPGLMAKYGWKTEEEAKKNVKVYKNYQDLLNDKDIEAVIIALPLHIHAQVAMEAMKKGKHVLCEKLMAQTVGQCKDMARTSLSTGKLLSIGHQRHYSIVYDNVVDSLRRGSIGDIHFIRALWHRANMPGKDSWSPPLPDQVEADIKSFEAKIKTASGKQLHDYNVKLRVLKAQLLDKGLEELASKNGYESKKLSDGRERSALEELIRWRLWDRTGGGLMAELGGHQLDASSIFIDAVHHPDNKPGETHKRVQPLTVTGVGGRHIFPEDRDVDDHVYCIYEFPSPKYAEDPNKKIVVTYSSINGNGLDGWGETVFGTSGTMMVEREREMLLIPAGGTASKLTVAAPKGGSAVETSETGGGAGASGAGLAKAALSAEAFSRGYKEEIEHLAWCIRNPDPKHRPRCGSEIGLADAIMALAANKAMRDHTRIEFKPEWFEIASDETLEGTSPSVPMPGSNVAKSSA